MNKTTKTLLIIASTLTILGLGIFLCAMTRLKWDFSKIATVTHINSAKFQTNTHPISDAFDNISINTDASDIYFKISTDNEYYVECYEKENSKHLVTVDDNSLVINSTDEDDNIFFNIEFFMSSPKITLYLPQKTYSSLSVTTDTGNINIDSINFSETIKLESDTGSLNLINLSCNELSIDAETGDINLTDIIADYIFSLETDTGDINFKDCDAAEILATTDTGDISGTFVSDKIFITKSDIGTINVPKTTTGGRCELTTDTGAINITINK